MIIDWGEFSTEEERQRENREEDEEDEGEAERWSVSDERTLRSSGSSWKRGTKKEIGSPKLVEVVLVSSRKEEETRRRVGGCRSRSGSRGGNQGRLIDSLSALVSRFGTGRRERDGKRG